MSETKPTARAVRAALKELATAERAQVSARYFKTGKGEYGHGDVFVGVTVPDQRKVAARFKELPLAQCDVLLTSKVHEERLTALFILVGQFSRANKSPEARRAIFELYVRRIAHVNNWDLVDSSAPQLVGGWLLDKDRALLDELASSTHLWSRRIAMLATLLFIKKGEASDALRIAERLVHDEHDLMHKAVGWMLREVGEKVGLEPLRGFLKRHAATMPRTMLRYALEKLPAEERKVWMAKAKAKPA